MKTRFCYLLLTLLIITTGMLSRKVGSVPLWIGDILYALMAYFIVRFMFVHKRPSVIAVVSLSFCCLIEFSQLYQATWINNIRHTLPGHLILGQGFLWTDLIAYVFGAAMGLTLDHLINNSKANTH